MLVLFLTNSLSFEENSATAIYHAFAMLCYFTPLFGAPLADGFLGKFWYVKSRTHKQISMEIFFSNLIANVYAVTTFACQVFLGEQLVNKLASTMC